MPNAPSPAGASTANWPSMIDPTQPNGSPVCIITEAIVCRGRRARDGPRSSHLEEGWIRDDPTCSLALGDSGALAVPCPGDPAAPDLVEEVGLGDVLLGGLPGEGHDVQIAELERGRECVPIEVIGGEASILGHLGADDFLDAAADRVR